MRPVVPSTFAEMAGIAPAQQVSNASNDTARGGGQQISEENARALRQSRLNDAPLPNESTRRDAHSEDEFVDAAAKDAMRREEMTQEELDYIKNNKARSASMGKTLSRSVSRSSPRVKTRTLDKLLKNESRRRPQLSFDKLPFHRPANAVKGIQKSIARAFGKHGVGSRIYGKIIPMPSLDLREIGVGSQEIAALVEQNPDMLDKLIRANIPADRLAEYNFTSTRIMTIDEIATLINENEVYVFTAKPPNNRGQDIQRRRLVILENEQRGIYLHPFMAATYTADFDGDDMNISLDPDNMNNAKDPMEHIIGIDGELSIDMDWIPISPIVDGYEDGKTARDYVKEIMLSEWSDVNERYEGLFDSLVDSILELSQSAKQGDSERNLAYSNFVFAAKNFARAWSKGRNRSNRTMSKIIKTVYQEMRNLRINDSLMTAGEIVSREELPKAKTMADEAIYKVIDGIVLGAAPNNFQELKVAMNGFLGNVEGKSAPFRFGGDVGKVIKLDSRMQIGEGGGFVVDPDNKEDMLDFLQATMKFAYAYRMTTDVKERGKSFYYTEILRNNVIAEVGFPDQKSSMYEFLKDFVKSYNKHAAAINEANLVRLMNMSIDSNSNRKTVHYIKNANNPSYRDIASPFIDVYGTYSFDRIFGGLISYEDVDPFSVKAGKSNKFERDWYRTSNGYRWIKSRYKLMNIRSFSVNNHIVLKDEEKGKYINALLYSAVDNDGYLYDQDVIDGLILAIADKRTSTSSKFNTSVMGKYDSSDGIRTSLSDKTGDGKDTLMKMMSDELTDIAELLDDNSNDQILAIDDAIMALYATNYDMFHDLIMDSTQSFLTSKYTDKLIEHAGNLDVLAGIREAMVFEWQTLGITRIADKLRELRDNPTVVDIATERLRLENQAKFAMDELSAKSIAWEGIISEMRAFPENSAFVQLKTHQGRSVAQYWKAIDFWASDTQYTSIRQVIEDLDMPWPLKCDIITDVVRYQTQDYQVQPLEIAYQLEVGGDARFSLNDSAPKSALSVYQDAESASHRYANYSLRNMREEVRKASVRHRKKPGHLTNTIRRLANSPWETIMIDDGMFAEAIMAVRDKVYAQTEKAQKHPAINAIYSALSLQRNGGYFNDVYRMDDRTLGLQHMSQISVHDLLKILDDPTYMLSVYNDDGSIGLLNQHKLLGLDHDASEEEMWDFLVNNPRFACILRAGSACVTTEAKNRGYLGARLSLDETLNAYGDGGYNPMGHVKYLMRDHPVYAGLISLLNPAHNTSTRNDRSRIQDIENKVCWELLRASKEEGELGASVVLNNFRITREKLQSLLTSDYDKYMASMGFGWDTESIGEAKQEADDMYNILEQHIAKYLSEIGKNVRTTPRYLEMIKENNDLDFNIDIESIASFWDAVQELNGAKVAVSTGIEGRETFQFSYWVSHMGVKDRYASLEAIADLITNSENPTEFNGMWTNKGPLIVEVGEDGSVVTNISELCLSKTNPSEEIITRVPEGFDVPDRSTDSYGNPVPSLYVSMVSKRANGAEKFNLKAMKSGLDGLDSVIKMIGGKYLTEQYGDGSTSNVIFFNVQNEHEQLAASEGIDAARMELANRLMQQDRQMGYDDMTLSNYMSIAEIMLVENTDGGITLRSIEQLVAGIKGRMGSRVEEMEDEEVRKQISEMLTDTSENSIGRSFVDDVYGLLDNMRPASSANNSTSSMYVSASVFERNYNLLQEIQSKMTDTPLSDSEQISLHEMIVGDEGVPGIKEVFKRSNIVRNYRVVGYAGSTSGNQMIDNRAMGSSNAVIIGDGVVSKSAVQSICDMAYNNGVTVIVSSVNTGTIPSEYVADMIPINKNGDMMIPMFDARLNGSEARPFQPRFAIFQVPFSRYVISVEDAYNVFNLGDAQYKFTRNMVSRMKQRDGGNVTKDVMQLFPNVFANKEYTDANFLASLATREVVENFICNPSEPACTIDYGLVEGAKGFAQRVRNVNTAIRKYKQNFDWLNCNDCVMRGIDLNPGDIVAWVDLTIERRGMEPKHVLAPIIPFELHGANRSPATFKIPDVGSSYNDGSLFSINWSSENEFHSGGYIKYFDSSGGANKGMINLTDILEDTMILKNGLQVDAYCAAQSTASRKIGTDRRIKSMISLMAMARMEGYNFAKTKEAFPNDPEIKEALLSGRLPTDFWANYFIGAGEHDTPVLFTNDKEMNAFLNYECKKIFDNGGNPSDYLASTFMGEDGNEHNSNVMWEFECMFDNSLHYEDALLKFLHLVNPGLCPNGINDATEDKTFRLYREGADDLGAGYDRGMLQVKAPFPMSDSNISYVWSSVAVGLSFFGEEYSGHSRPNVSGASDMLDAENTGSYYGVVLNDEKSKLRAAWATADLSSVAAPDGGALGSG